MLSNSHLILSQRISTIVAIKLYFILILACLFSCKNETQLTDTDNLPNFESFGEESFAFASEESFSFNDAQFDSEGNILIIGDLPDFPVKPRLIRMDPEFNVISASDIITDNRSIFRTMDLITASDDEFVYCSRIANGNSFKVDIQKISSSGVQLWQRSIGSPDTDLGGLSITQCEDGNLIALAENLEISFQDSCFYLMTIDRNGSLIKQLKIIDPEIVRMRKVLYVESDKTILVLGQYGFDASGSFQGNIKVSKYSLEGELLSSRILIDNSDFFSNASDMKLTDDGNILVYVSSNDSANPNNPTIQIIMIDTDLNEMWRYDYDDIRFNIVDEIQEVGNGDLLILSKSSTLTNEEFDVILTSLSGDFEINWIKSYGTTSSDQGSRLLIDDNNDIVVIGNSNHNTGTLSTFEYFILKTDSEGIPK